MSNFTDYGYIDTSPFRINELDWDNHYTKLRNESAPVHQHTSVIPLKWDMEGLWNEKSYQSPPTEFYERYYDEDFFEELLEKVNGSYFVRILFTKLNRGGSIYPHEDFGDSLRQNRRIHIPLKTNEQILFSVGGEVRNLKVGQITEIDNTQEHWVENKSNEDRIHLIVDIYDK